MGKVAYDFSASANYNAGDLCMYNGDLYVFTVSHSGVWNDEHVQRVDNNTEQELTRIEAAYDEAKTASDFAESLVFEPELITGTRYKYLIN